jgi:CRISPR-associated protein Cmr5
MVAARTGNTQNTKALRRERAFAQALEHVGAVDKEEQAKVKDIYGGLCIKFPVMLRQNGLRQTIAFIEDKASGKDDRARAYRLLRRHIAANLGLEEGKIVDRLRDMSALEIVRYTRLLLAAWVYYKRFAVSILGAEATAEPDR